MRFLKIETILFPEGTFFLVDFSSTRQENKREKKNIEKKQMQNVYIYISTHVHNLAEKILFSRIF